MPLIRITTYITETLAFFAFCAVVVYGMPIAFVAFFGQ